MAVAEPGTRSSDSLKNGSVDLSTGLTGTGRARFEALSKAKMSKAIWMTSYEPNLVWGNQEPMWPLSKGAMKAVASERVEQVARPKTNWQLNSPEKCSRPHFQYSCGRSSVIWDVSQKAMKGQPSERTELLARHKTVPSLYKEDRPEYPLGCGRSSPIWSVTDGAKNAEERPHTCSLAAPKKTHQNYVPCRDVQWPVSSRAQRAEASARTEILARPKSRREGPYRDPNWSVNKSCLRITASARVVELSKPKQVADGFVPNRDVEWRPPRTALRAYTTERMKGLSQPIVRDSMDHVQFNPDAFKVSEAARKARISERVSDLARPIERGMKVKAG